MLCHSYQMRMALHFLQEHLQTLVLPIRFLLFAVQRTLTYQALHGLAEQDLNPTPILVLFG